MQSPTNVGTGRSMRPTGSELLLQKLPLYAQAKKFAEVDPSDPLAECNTLAFGSDAYPLLQLLRQCDAVLGGGGRGEEGVNDGSIAVQHNAPFVGIHTRFTRAPQRMWWAAASSSSQSASRGESVGTDAQLLSVQSGSLAKAEAHLLDAAVTLPTELELLRGSIGVVERSLAQETRKMARAEREYKRTRAQARTGTNEESDAKRTRTTGAENGDETKSEGVTETEGNDEDVASDRNALAKDSDDLWRSSSSGDAWLASMTLYERNLAAFCSASEAEKEMLSAITATATERQGTAFFETQQQQVDEGKSAVAVSASIPIAVASWEWGPRMFALINETTTVRTSSSTAATAAASSCVSSSCALISANAFGATAPMSASSAYSAAAAVAASEASRNMQAYLKRLSWVETRKRGSMLPIAGDGSVSWGQMKESQRVKMEMQHTQDQRNRYRRTRGGGGAGSQE